MTEAERGKGSNRFGKAGIRSAVAFIVAFAIAVVSAMELHGWHKYAGFALVAAGLCIGLLSWRRKRDRAT
jgi:hypothetical protein